MAPAAKKPDTFFDLSFAGSLPAMLRALADRIEREEVATKEFEWKLTEDYLDFSARLDMKPKE